MRFWKNGVLFYLGGCGYMGLELLWRGWSHGSMFVAGGSCFLLLGKLSRLRVPLAMRTILGSMGVTLVELVTGLLVNRNHQVWDYRRLPFQFRGQISLIYSLLWLPVSLMGMALYNQVNGRLFSGSR